MLTPICGPRVLCIGPAGLLRWMKDPRLVATNSPEKYEYTQDAMGRKAWVIYPKDSYNQNRSEHFTYDDAGRLYQFKNRRGNVQTFTYEMVGMGSGINS